MWATPVESIGKVLRATKKTFSSLSAARCRWRAPVFLWRYSSTSRLRVLIRWLRIFSKAGWIALSVTAAIKTILCIEQLENYRVTRSIRYDARNGLNKVACRIMTDRTPKHIDAPEVAAWWAERRQYLERIRKVPEIRQRFWREVAIYLLRRLLWSFGFFPIFIAFWLPFVLSSFNPVVMASDMIPLLQGFVNSNPEQQATTISTLTIAWLSIGSFFLVFDFVLTPFRSPYQYEADVYMKSWEQLNHDQLPDKM